jgi:large subunit ribosomal protein L4
MVKIPVYNESGEQVGSEQMDEALLGGQVNAALLKQAVVMYHANRRQGSVAQKRRCDVEGSTRKLYRQKGTGRARMGTIRTPVRRGGGRTFPRKPKDFRHDMPRKMRRLARNQAILSKIQNQQALIVDGLKLDEPKTKRFARMLRAVRADRGCIVATGNDDQHMHLSGRNLPRAEVLSVSDLNAGVILSRRHLVFTRSAFDRLHGLVSAGGEN